jgi:hypothetical protein
MHKATSINPLAHAKDKSDAVHILLKVRSSLGKIVFVHRTKISQNKKKETARTKEETQEEKRV